MYPYLGLKVINEKNIIIFFIEENKGVILYDDNLGDDEYKVGKLCEVDENEWDFYPEGAYIRLSN
jgi:hypothetical protein